MYNNPSWSYIGDVLRYLASCHGPKSLGTRLMSRAGNDFRQREASSGAARAWTVRPDHRARRQRPPRGTDPDV